MIRSTWKVGGVVWSCSEDRNFKNNKKNIRVLTAGNVGDFKEIHHITISGVTRNGIGDR